MRDFVADQVYDAGPSIAQNDEVTKLPYGQPSIHLKEKLSELSLMSYELALAFKHSRQYNVAA
jgi:hypothetical protein